MSDLAERIREINETVEACRHGNVDGLTIAMIWDSTAKQAGELLMANAPAIIAAIEAAETVPDLGMIVVRLSRSLPKDDKIRIAALDYLARKGLMPSPLREKTE